MAQAFNLTAQLNLQGPTNINKIVGDIRKQIGTIEGEVKFKVDASTVKNVTQLNSALQTLNATLSNTTSVASNAARALGDLKASISGINAKSIASDVKAAASATTDLAKASKQSAKDLSDTKTELEEFGKQSALAIRRFAAFSVVSGVIFKVSNSLNQGLAAAIDFERQMVRLEQITGQSAKSLTSLSKTLTDLSTGLGVSSQSLIGIADTLAQAGLSAKDTATALKALALTELAPSFDSMNETVEGSIALMRQFSISADDLQKSLGSINAVAARFAVESSDLITAIQRTGGVFATASKGVSEGTDALNEFLAVFTSVRATTRESAETIATGLRTIFTRIQREDTIEALQEYGVQLTDLDGKFVGAYKAVEALSRGLSKIDPRSIEFSSIVEELGGFRQIGKVIPLIQQFSTAQEALKVAQTGQSSLAYDAVKAQQSLANQIVKVREQFLALMREVGQSDAFQTLARGALGFASAMLSVADAIKGVLPVLAIIGIRKGISALTEFGKGFTSGLKKVQPDQEETSVAGSVGRTVGQTVSGAKAERESRSATEVSAAAKALSSSVSDLSNKFVSIENNINNLASYISSNINALNANTSSLDSLTAAIQNINLGGTNVPPTQPGLNSGGFVRGFASGGTVPGSGSRDSVPAMLTPGEFVINKKAAQNIGLNNLQKANRYSGGGKLQRFVAGGKPRRGVPNQVNTTDVVDGDTIGADIFTNLTFRFSGVDAPEKSEPLGENATSVLVSKGLSYFNDKVTSGVGGKSRGIFKDDSLAGEMIRKGLAVPDIRYAGNKFDNDVAAGRKGKMGLWNSSYANHPKRLQFKEQYGYNSGGLIQHFASGGIAEKAKTEGKTVQQIILEYLDQYGGAVGVKQILGIRKGDRTLDSILQRGNIKAGKNIDQAVSFMDQAIEAREKSGAARADAIEAATKFNLVGLLPIDYNKDFGPEDIGGRSTFIMARGMSSTYADLIQEMQQELSGISEKYAEKLQMRQIFGTTANKPLVFDFDETLVDRSEDLMRLPDGSINIAGFNDPDLVKRDLNNTILTRLGEELRNRLNSGQISLDNIRVVTARPQTNAPFIADALARLGLNIPVNQITGTSGPENKINNITELETLIDDRLATVNQFRKAGRSAVQYAPLAKGLNNPAIAAGQANLEGAVIEKILANFGAPLKPDAAPNRPIDYPDGLGIAAQYFGVDPNLPTEVKRTIDNSSLARTRSEIERYYNENISGFVQGGGVSEAYAKGLQKAFLEKYKKIIQSILPKEYITDDGFLKTPSGKAESIEIKPPEDIREKSKTTMMDILLGRGSALPQEKSGASYSGGLIYKMIRKNLEAAKGSLPDSEYKTLKSFVDQNLMFEGGDDKIDLTQQARPGSLAHETFHDIQGYLLDYYPEIYKKLEQGVANQRQSIEKWYSDPSTEKWRTQRDYQLKHLFPESIADSPYRDTVLQEAMSSTKKITKQPTMSPQFWTDVYSETMKDLGKAEAIPVLLAAAAENNQGAQRILSDIFGAAGLNNMFYKSMPKYASGGAVAEPEKKTKNYGKISITEDGGMISAGYLKNESRKGYANAYKMRDYLYYVGISSATGGYGPRLYDVLMEAVTEKGAMLTSDRNMVSGDAQGVWSYYFRNRSDVTKTPLDPKDWTKNNALIDPKLYGRKETWPPSTDPAWILQSGYSKNPSLINDPESVIRSNKLKIDSASMATQYFQKAMLGGYINRFADGGYVPALLTPGEAVIAPEMAKKIGYGNLKRMNQADRNGYGKYAKGGGVSIVPGSGNTDTYGPVPLQVGSFVIRKKATEALGFNRGGNVGVQKFAFGGQPIGTGPVKIADEFFAREVQGLSSDIKTKLSMLRDVLSKIPNIFPEDSIDEARRKTTQAFLTVSRNIDQLGPDTVEAIRAITGKLITAFDKLEMDRVNRSFSEKFPLVTKDLVDIIKSDVSKAARTRANVLKLEEQRPGDMMKFFQDVVGYLPTPLSPETRVPVPDPANLQDIIDSSARSSRALGDFQAAVDYVRNEVISAAKAIKESTYRTSRASGFTVAESKGFAQIGAEFTAKQKANEFLNNPQLLRDRGFDIGTDVRPILKALQISKTKDLALSKTDLSANMANITPNPIFAKTAEQLIADREKAEAAAAQARQERDKQALEDFDKFIRRLDNAAAAIALFGNIVGGLIPTADKFGYVLNDVVKNLSTRVGTGIASISSVMKTTQDLAQNKPGLFGIPAGPGGKAANVDDALGIANMAGGATAVATGLYVLAGIAKDTYNSMIEFEKQLSSKRIEVATASLSSMFKNLERDLQNIGITKAIDNQLDILSNNLNRLNKLTSTGSMQWLNFGDQFVAYMNENVFGMQGETRRANEQALILERLGTLAYDKSSDVFGSIGQDRVDSNRFNYMVQDIIPQLVAEQAQANQVFLDQLIRTLEPRLRQGTSRDEILRSLGTENAPSARAQTLATLDLEAATTIRTIQARNDLSEQEKETTIKSIQYAAAYNILLDESTKALRNLELEKLNKVTNQFVTSMERIFNSLEQSIGKTQFDLDRMSLSIKATTNALTGQAQASQLQLKSINVLRNPRAYSERENIRARNLGSSFFGQDAQTTEALLSLGQNLEDALMGAINRTIAEDRSAGEKKISSRVEKAAVDAIGALDLPDSVRSMTQNQTREAIRQIRKRGDETISFQELAEKIPALSKQIDVARRAQESATKALEYWQGILNSYAEAMNRQVQYQIDINNYSRRAQDIQRKGFIAIQDALEKEVSVRDRINLSLADVASRTGGTVQPTEISQNIYNLENLRQAQQDIINKIGDSSIGVTDKFKFMENQLAITNVSLRENYAALEQLANSSDIASAGMAKINEVANKIKTGVSFIEKLVTSTPADISKLNRNFDMLSNNMSGVANPYSNAEGRSERLQLFNSIAPLLGTGQKQNELRANVLTSMLQEANIPLNSTMQNILQSLRDPESSSEMQEAIRVYNYGNDLQIAANTELAAIKSLLAKNDLEMSNQQLVSGFDNVIKTYADQQLKDIANNTRATVDLLGSAKPATTRSSGGVIYASDGASIFSPKGSDTVPAMLTPGEFVVNKESTAKNLPLLKSINSSKTRYYNDGGYVIGGVWGGTDKGFVLKTKLDEANARDKRRRSGPEDYPEGYLSDFEYPNFDDIFNELPKKVYSYKFPGLAAAGRISDSIISKDTWDEYISGRTDISEIKQEIDSKLKWYPGIFPKTISSSYIDVGQKGFNSTDTNYPTLGNLTRTEYSLLGFAKRRQDSRLTRQQFDDYKKIFDSNFSVIGNSVDAKRSSFLYNIYETIQDYKNKKFIIDQKELDKKLSDLQVRTILNTSKRSREDPYRKISISNLTGRMDNIPALGLDSQISISSLRGLKDNMLGWSRDANLLSGSSSSLNPSAAFQNFGIASSIDNLTSDIYRNMLDNTISLFDDLPKISANLVNDQFSTETPEFLSEKLTISKLEALYKGFTKYAELDYNEWTKFGGIGIPENIGPASLFPIKLISGLMSIPDISYEENIDKLLQQKYKGLVIPSDLTDRLKQTDSIVDIIGPNGTIPTTLTFPLQNINAAGIGEPVFTKRIKTYGNPADPTSWPVNYEDFEGYMYNDRIKAFDFQAGKKRWKIIDPKLQSSNSPFYNPNLDELMITEDAVNFDNLDLLFSNIMNGAPLYITKKANELLVKTQNYNSDPPGMAHKHAYLSDMRKISRYDVRSRDTWFNIIDKYKENQQSQEAKKLEGRAPMTEDFIPGTDPSFTEAKRVTLARIAYDLAKNHGFDLGNKPRSLQDIENIRNLLNTQIGLINDPNSDDSISAEALRRTFTEIRGIEDLGKGRSYLLSGYGIDLSSLNKGTAETIPDPNFAGKTKTLYWDNVPGSENISEILNNIIEREVNVIRSQRAGGLIIPEDVMETARVSLENGKFYDVGPDGTRKEIKDQAKVLPSSYSDIFSRALTPTNIFPNSEARSNLISILQSYYSNRLNPTTGQPLFTGDYTRFMNSNLEALKDWYKPLQDSLLNTGIDAETLKNDISNFDVLRKGLEQNYPAAQTANSNVTANVYGRIPNADELKSYMVRQLETKQPQTLATGGMVYANDGQLINFQSRGTDTVPAMLTPGEFVVNRAATQKNLPLLQSINRGNYLADGGIPTMSLARDNKFSPQLITSGTETLDPKLVRALDFFGIPETWDEYGALIWGLSSKVIPGILGTIGAGIGFAAGTPLGPGSILTGAAGGYAGVQAGEAINKWIYDYLLPSDLKSGIDIQMQQHPENYNAGQWIGFASELALGAKYGPVIEQATKKGIKNVLLSYGDTMNAASYSKLTESEISLAAQRLQKESDKAIRSGFSESKKVTGIHGTPGLGMFEEAAAAKGSLGEAIQPGYSKSGYGPGADAPRPDQLGMYGYNFNIGGMFDNIGYATEKFNEAISMALKNKGDYAAVQKAFDDAGFILSDINTSILDNNIIRLTRKVSEEKPDLFRAVIADLKLQGKTDILSKLGNGAETKWWEVLQAIKESVSKNIRNPDGTIDAALLDKVMNEALAAQNINIMGTRALASEVRKNGNISGESIAVISNKILENSRILRLSELTQFKASFLENIRNKGYLVSESGRIATTEVAKEATGYQTGGLIYANNGQLINFQPRGTDTVPAMLTPGEFVVNRESTQKHISLLRAINSGEYSHGGLVSYLQNGGLLLPNYYQDGARVGPNNAGMGFDISNFMNRVIGQITSSITTAIKEGFAQTKTPTTATTGVSNNVDSNLSTMDQFVARLDRIANTLKDIDLPPEIKIVGRHDVNVIINGDAVLSQLKPELADLVMSSIKQAFGKFKNNNPAWQDSLNFDVT